MILKKWDLSKKYHCSNKLHLFWSSIVISSKRDDNILIFRKQMPSECLDICKKLYCTDNSYPTDYANPEKTICRKQFVTTGVGKPLQQESAEQ